MSNGKFYHDIKALLERNGEMGVNQLAKELNVPLSTMQKYLDKDQNYFKKTHSRKWTLPENAAQSDMSAVSDNYGNIIDSQLLSMNALIDTLMSQFRATVTLIEANKGRMAPVAGNSVNIEPELLELDKNLKNTYAVFKKYVSKVPEEYQELIKGLDLARLTLELGTKFMNHDFNADLTSLFLEQSKTLPEDTIEILKEYQKT